jgi:hypothetical protein
VTVARVVKQMVQAVTSHFTDEGELRRQFGELRRAADGVEESSRALDEEIAKTQGSDQFQIFAEGARKSRF